MGGNTSRSRRVAVGAVGALGAVIVAGSVALAGPAALATTGRGVQLGPIGIAIGGPSPTPSARPVVARVGIGTAPVSTPTPTDTLTPPDLPSPAPSPAAVPAAPVALAPLRVTVDAATIYPRALGYRDHAVFHLHVVSVDGTTPPVAGRAVLRLAKRTVKTWTVSSADAVLTWNGRVGGVVRPGTYHLTVGVASAGQAVTSTSSVVRVSSKHFARGTSAIEAPADSDGVASTMPERAAHAFRYGKVSVRIATDATVHGPATLLFVSSSGTFALHLRNGSHVTPAVTVPNGVVRFTVFTRWADGAVQLHSLRVRWTYKRLVR